MASSSERAMDTRTFFEKFETFADAPNAIEKMRELALGLAFSGGLSGAITNGSGMPSGWEQKTVDELSLSIEPGFACSKSHQVAGGHVHLRTHNISTLGVLNFDLVIRIDPKKVEASKASIRKGDILFNNTNSQELVGKTALVDRDYDYGFSNHITRLRVNDSAWPPFIVYYLTYLRNSGHFARLCTRWIGQAAINTKALRAEQVPLPPLAEQKRIVAKVDELMALCDRLEAEQKEREAKHTHLARAALARFADAPTPANLDYLFHHAYTIDPVNLRQSILTMAVQGKLLPPCITFETAQLLMDSITRERTASKLKSPNATDLDDDEIPYGLPVTWKWTTLGSIALYIQYGFTASADSSINDVKMLRITDIQNGRVNWSTVPGCAIDPIEADKTL